MTDLTLVSSYLFSWLTSIFNLYLTHWFLTGVLALWLVRRIARLFDRL